MERLSGYGAMFGVALLLASILFSALVGGGVRFFQKSSEDSSSFWRYALVGLACSSVTPLFLNFIGNSTIDHILTAIYDAKYKDVIKYTLIFVGFCTLSSYVGLSFLNKVSDAALRVSNEAKSLGEKNQQAIDSTNVLILNALSDQFAEEESNNVVDSAGISNDVIEKLKNLEDSHFKIFSQKYIESECGGEFFEYASGSGIIKNVKTSRGPRWVLSAMAHRLLENHLDSD